MGVESLEPPPRLVAAKAPHEREVLAGTIDATDREIDRLVYELYGLTEEEIAVVPTFRMSLITNSNFRTPPQATGVSSRTPGSCS